MRGWRSGLVLAVVLGQATGAAAFTPVRVPYRAASLKVIEAAPSEPWKFADGLTLRPIDQGARESVIVGTAFPDAIAFAETVPGCAGALRIVDNEMQEVMLIEWNYRGREDQGGGWEWSKVDRHYKHHVKAAQALRACMVKDGLACGASPLRTTDLLDFLDLHVEDDAGASRCVRGGAFTLAKAPLRYDAKRGGEGQLRTNRPALPMTLTQLQLLTALEDAHEVAAQGGAADVRGAAARFEASCRTPEQCNAFRLYDFSARRGSGWTDGEIHTWKRVQDVFFHDWGTCLRAGNTECSDLANKDHRDAHLCAALPRSMTFTFAFSVAGVGANSWPEKTCAAWAAAFA